VKKNLFTFNFKKLPAAFLLLLVLLLCTNTFFEIGFNNGLLPASVMTRQHHNVLAKVRSCDEKPQILVIGDSRAFGINTEILGNIISSDNKNKILTIILTGGTPRAFLFVLKKAKFKCVKNGGGSVIMHDAYGA